MHQQTITRLDDNATHLHHFVIGWLQQFSKRDQQTWMIVLLRELFKDNPKEMNAIIVLAAKQLGFQE